MEKLSINFPSQEDKDATTKKLIEALEERKKVIATTWDKRKRISTRVAFAMLEEIGPDNDTQ